MSFYNETTILFIQALGLKCYSERNLLLDTNDQIIIYKNKYLRYRNCIGLDNVDTTNNEIYLDIFNENMVYELVSKYIRSLTIEKISILFNTQTIRPILLSIDSNNCARISMCDTDRVIISNHMRNSCLCYIDLLLKINSIIQKEEQQCLFGMRNKKE